MQILTILGAINVKINKKKIIYVFFLLILVMCQGLVIKTHAQKVPIALQDKTLLAPINKATYKKAAEDYMANGGKTKENRNRLVFLAVSQIDNNFRYYQRNRRVARDLFQTVMDILEIGASTAISITNGARAKSIIGEGLTFIQGGRASANKNLKLLEMQILFNKMIEKRSEILTSILDKCNLSDEQYPFDRALVDITAYFNAGTMDYALSALNNDTGAAAKAAQDLLQAKINAGITGAPSQKQIDATDVNFRKLREIFEHNATLQKVIDDEKAKPTPNAQIIKDAEEKQTKILDGVRVLFLLIEADSNLSPLLDEIPKKYGKDNPTAKLRLENGLNKLKTDSKNAKIDDYEFILLKLNGVVIEKLETNGVLNESLLKILNTYKKP